MYNSNVIQKPQDLPRQLSRRMNILLDLRITVLETITDPLQESSMCFQCNYAKDNSLFWLLYDNFDRLLERNWSHCQYLAVQTPPDPQNMCYAYLWIGSVKKREWSKSRARTQMVRYTMCSRWVVRTGEGFRLTFSLMRLIWRRQLRSEPRKMQISLPRTTPTCCEEILLFEFWDFEP